MAYHNHLSRDLPLHGFTGQPTQPLSENSSRPILPDQFTAGPTAKSHHQHHHQTPLQTAPNWLNNALLRTQNSHSHFSSATNNANINFLNLHSTASDSPASHSSNQWLSRSIFHRNHSDVIDEAGDALISPSAATLSPESTELNNNANSGEALSKSDGGRVEANGDGSGGEGFLNWQNAKYKAEILAHPLYDQLLSSHVACLRIATPVDQLPRIDEQLAQSQNIMTKYSALSHGAQSMVGDDKELDQFMTHYVLLLCSFKDHLQQHVRVHAMEAVTACWDIEQSLHSLTGVSAGEGTGATMSDDEDDQIAGDENLFDGSMDTTGFGPLVLTESERSLMERVRQELKHELKMGYKDKIVDIREEIWRKRRAGKLPGDTTSVLKAWWESHAKWPYPTEEDKARLGQETGLQMKQINNWFINQRKRNWHSNPSTSKTKRKR